MLHLRHRDLGHAVSLDLVQTQIGMWHKDFGFMEQERYDRIIKYSPNWDDAGYTPAFVLLPRKEQT